MDSTIEHFARRNHHGVNDTHNETVSTGSDDIIPAQAMATLTWR
jgi:hypothetical protein